MNWLAGLATLLIFGSGTFTYREALPGYRYSFPRDHFEHPDFRTEWWYYTGNVFDSSGKRFGFELVFFRLGEKGNNPPNRSAWRVDDLYLAHTALTDVNGKRFFYDERLNRGGPGVAGASFEKKRVWNANWSTQWNGERQTLTAVADDFRFTLEANPAKPLVIHGAEGVSQKSGEAGHASHYTSFTRLQVTGKMVLGDVQLEVSGTAWMDHEWFTELLAASQVGWDWFSVQLDNQTELMLFQLRRKDGSIDSYSSGTFVSASGKSRRLASSEFSLQPLEYWTSPRTGGRYPIQWKIEIPSLKLTLKCSAALENQELVTKYGMSSYWEGAVNYSGSGNGRGYLEMTGYDKPVSSELKR